MTLNLWPPFTWPPFPVWFYSSTYAPHLPQTLLSYLSLYILFSLPMPLRVPPTYLRLAPPSLNTLFYLPMPLKLSQTWPQTLPWTTSYLTPFPSAIFFFYLKTSYLPQTWACTWPLSLHDTYPHFSTRAPLTTLKLPWATLYLPLFACTCIYLCPERLDCLFPFSCTSLSQYPIAHDP